MCYEFPMHTQLKSADKTKQSLGNKKKHLRTDTSSLEEENIDITNANQLIPTKLEDGHKTCPFLFSVPATLGRAHRTRFP